MNLLSEEDTWRHLYEQYGLVKPNTRNITRVAREHGVSISPWDKGSVTVTLHGQNSFTVEPGVIGAEIHVARKGAGQYTRSPKTSRPARPGPARQITGSPEGRNKKMARATAVEESDEKDYTVYADKEPTQVMSDFADWLIDEVGVEYKAKELAAFRDGVRLGGTLRMEFQRSDVNQERLAERRAAKEAEAAEAEKPTRTTRTPKAAAGKAKAAVPAAKGRGKRGAPKADAPF